MSRVFYLPQHRRSSTRNPLALRHMWSTGCWVSADEKITDILLNAPSRSIIWLLFDTHINLSWLPALLRNCWLASFLLRGWFSLFFGSHSLVFFLWTRHLVLFCFSFAMAGFLLGNCTWCTFLIPFFCLRFSLLFVSTLSFSVFFVYFCLSGESGCKVQT